MWNQAQGYVVSSPQQGMSQLREEGTFRGRLQKTEKKRLHVVNEEQVFIDTISHLKSKQNVCYNVQNAWYENVCIAGISFKFKLDSGADCNILPNYCLEKIRSFLSSS